MNCASVTPQSVVVCRLCTKSHEYYVNIFISNESCEIIVEEAIQDLLGLPVTVGDGLPSVVCRLCVRKLIEFREFKNMCFKSATELRVYALGNDFLISNIKDEDASDVETSGEGTSQENSFRNDIHVTEVYITTPDELAIGNVSHAKEELWSTENALVVKEEVNDGEHRIEGFMGVNALTSVAEDPLAVDTMALKEESQEPKVAAGKGNSLGDTSPHNHIRVNEVFVPFPDELAMGIVRYAEEDSRPTELIVKDEISEGIECSENDVPVVSLSSVNVDPLAVDTSVDGCYNIGEHTMEPEKESETFGAVRQIISQKKVFNNPSCDPVPEETLPQEHSMANSSFVNCFPKKRVKNHNKNAIFYASSNKYSQLNDRPRRFTNLEREELCQQAEIVSYPTDYICIYCNTRCSEKKSLALHIKRHVDDKRSSRVLLKEDIPQRFSQRLLVKDLRNVQLVIHETSNISFTQNCCGVVKPIKCNKCGEMFNRKSDLIMHSVVHTGLNPFKCNECGKLFARKSRLKTHLLVHTGVKAFKCDECGKMFTRKDTLNTHLLVHTGVKPFKCNECGKMFSTRRELNTHSLVHTGVKPFKCNECGKMFARMSRLKTHLVVHTGVKLFECKECGKKFSLKSHLNVHSVVHSGVKPFKCDKCEKMFSTSSNLNKHSVVHTGVKAFKCDECGKMFNRNASLKRHSVVHTGVKPPSVTSVERCSLQKVI